MVIRGVVFDMDDTLYLERDYVKSGFRAVAEHVRSVVDKTTAFEVMWNMFESGVRGDTFDRLFSAHPELAETYTTKELVAVYRGHAPAIKVIPAMRALMETLRARGVALGLLSDGPLASQQAKADALNVADLVDHVVLTDALGREHWKPDPAGFELLARKMNCSHNSLVYVGDNPVKDFVAPKQLGWMAVRLRLPGQLRIDLEPNDATCAPHEDVNSIARLAELLGAGDEQ